MNGAIYQCSILRHGVYNFQLGVCKVLSYDHEKNDGSKWTWMIKYACA